MSVSSLLNWIDGLERTPPEDREFGSQFSVGWQQTRSELAAEIDRMGGVDRWTIDDVSGSNDDPGVVLRWTVDGVDHAAACDHYKKKSANLRALYLWFNEMRLSGERPIKTRQDQFAAAALPSGEEVEPQRPPPHEILGVQRNADDEVIEAVYKRLERRYHPDGESPDPDKLEDVRWAKGQLLG